MFEFAQCEYKFTEQEMRGIFLPKYQIIFYDAWIKTEQLLWDSSVYNLDKAVTLVINNECFISILRMLPVCNLLHCFFSYRTLQYEIVRLRLAWTERLSTLNTERS